MCCFLAFLAQVGVFIFVAGFLFSVLFWFYQSEGAVYLSWLLSETHAFSQMLEAITFPLLLCFLCTHLSALYSGSVSWLQGHAAHPSGQSRTGECALRAPLPPGHSAALSPALCFLVEFSLIFCGWVCASADAL